MILIGTNRTVLYGLKRDLMTTNQAVSDMQFVELPFCHVDDFDYLSIAKLIKEDGVDIIWVSLGAPKQETFMYRLKPYLEKGVMISVGVVFMDDSQSSGICLSYFPSSKEANKAMLFGDKSSTRSPI